MSPSDKTKQFEGSTFGVRTSNNKPATSSMKGQYIGTSPMMKSYENYAESQKDLMSNSKQKNNLLTIPKAIVTLMQEETESDDYANMHYP